MFLNESCLPPALSPTLQLAVRALCRCLIHWGFCTAPLSGAAPNTPLSAPKFPANSSTPGSHLRPTGLWWSCLKALVSPSHGSLLVWPHLFWPPQQCQGCAKLLHARQEAVCPDQGPAEMSGQQVHGHKSHVKRQGLLTQLQDLKTGLGPQKQSRLLGLGRGRRENAPAWDLLVLVPAAPLGSSFEGREPLNVCHHFYRRWSPSPTSAQL